MIANCDTYEKRVDMRENALPENNALFKYKFEWKISKKFWLAIFIIQLHFGDETMHLEIILFVLN